jgi:hypothetical protein
MLICRMMHSSTVGIYSLKVYPLVEHCPKPYAGDIFMFGVGSREEEEENRKTAKEARTYSILRVAYKRVRQIYYFPSSFNLRVPAELIFCVETRMTMWDMFP